MSNIRVKIPGKTYAKANQEGWLSSLAVFCYLCKRHTGKSFYFKKGRKTELIKKLSKEHNIGFTMLCKHLKVLQQEGLVSVKPNEIKLAKNRDLFRKKQRYVFVPSNINNLKDIKIFLSGIPIISNLVAQDRAIKRIKHYNYLREQRSVANRYVKTHGFRSLKKYEDRGGKMIYNEGFRLSYERIKEISGIGCRNLIAKIKKLLKEKGILSIHNQKEKVVEYRISFCEFQRLIKYGVLDNQCFFYKGWVYRVMPSLFNLKYRAASFT